MNMPLTDILPKDNTDNLMRQFAEADVAILADLFEDVEDKRLSQEFVINRCMTRVMVRENLINMRLQQAVHQSLGSVIAGEPDAKVIQRIESTAELIPKDSENPLKQYLDEQVMRQKRFMAGLDDDHLEQWEIIEDNIGIRAEVFRKAYATILTEAAIKQFGSLITEVFSRPQKTVAA